MSVLGELAAAHQVGTDLAGELADAAARTVGRTFPGRDDLQTMATLRAAAVLWHGAVRGAQYAYGAPLEFFEEISRTALADLVRAAAKLDAAEGGRSR